VRDDPIHGTLGRFVSWTVASNNNADTYLATITLFGIDDLDYKSGEVGYRTHPDARGRGVLTSALRSVVAFAFTPLEAGGVGLERLSLLAGDGNDASIGIARSLGFTEVGRDRRCYDLNDGRIVDLVRFDLLREEFRGDS
jgi:RimJ/RimL family protein N-acetyltransferase